MAYMKTAQESIQPDPMVRRFEATFQARVEHSKEYRQYRRPNLDRFKYDEPYSVELEVVPMKAIHMPVERFDKLLQQQEYIDRLESDANYGKNAWRKQQLDEHVRANNPAVDKAYRNYITLLELARN